MLIKIHQFNGPVIITFTYQVDYRVHFNTRTVFCYNAMNMQCWSCKETAKGICILCGRGVCKEHARRNPNILAAYDEDNDVPQVLMVDDALWCGICKPIPNPVPMPEL